MSLRDLTPQPAHTYCRGVCPRDVVQRQESVGVAPIDFEILPHTFVLMITVDQYEIDMTKLVAPQLVFSSLRIASKEEHPVRYDHRETVVACPQYVARSDLVKVKQPRQECQQTASPDSDFQVRSNVLS